VSENPKTKRKEKRNADLDYCGSCFGNGFDQHCEKLQKEMTMPPGDKPGSKRLDFFGIRSGKREKP